MKPVLQEITLRNILSFGPDTAPLPLGPLNVLIGPNGSGKSNFLEAISLLQAAPKNLSVPIRESGGVRDWLWLGAKNPTASIEAIVDPFSYSSDDIPLRHKVSFFERGQVLKIATEHIGFKFSNKTNVKPISYYNNENGHICIRAESPDPQGEATEKSIEREKMHPDESVLSQIRVPFQYPMLSALSVFYGRISLYREWSFGRNTPPRQPQKADLSSTHLSENCENLAHVLNAIRPHAKKEILEALSSLYPEIEDFNIQFPAGWVQLFLEEGKFNIPATRLSDGTLRYLCLLAILCHPEPPPLVCIEEPEMGLHPDVLPDLAKLMIAASERCQLIITTHSDVLVDALSEIPESVVVCEKHNGCTEMKRLDKDALAVWLEKYSLGELWTRGELGGNRW